MTLAREAARLLAQVDQFIAQARVLETHPPEDIDRKLMLKIRRAAARLVVRARQAGRQ